MKKLIVALMVLSTLASCGKDNKVASPAAPVVSTSNTAVTSTTTDPAGQALVSLINSYTTSFGTGRSVEYNMYFKDLIALSQYTIKYKYTKAAMANASNTECSGKYIQFCYTKWNSETQVTEPALSREVLHGGVVVATKQAELIDIINKRHPGYPIVNNGIGVFYIKTIDNTVYVIDTRFPLQANPAQITNSAGTETLFSVKLQ